MLPHSAGDGFRIVLAGQIGCFANHAQYGNGQRRIEQETRHQHQANDFQHVFRHPVHPGKKEGFHRVHHQHAQQAEGDQGIGAHAAIQIETLMAVIPPAGMEQLFHQIAGQVFQRAAQRHGQYEHRHRFPFVAAEQRGHCYGPEAINGAVRPDEKATIDEPVKLDQLAGDLHDPAQAGSDKKEQ